MTDKKDKALKLALEFIERTSTYLPTSFDGEGLSIHTAIREALMSVSDGTQSRSDVEHPAPATEVRKQQSAERVEPVAWFDKELNNVKWKDGLRNSDLADQQPLYTSPQSASKPWSGLTEGERNAIERKHGLRYFDEVFHDIEAKLREKNQ